MHPDEWTNFKLTIFLFSRGLRKLMFKYFMFGVGEYYRGIIISAQVKQLQRYVPSLKLEDVER